MRKGESRRLRLAGSAAAMVSVAALGVTGLAAPAGAATSHVRTRTAQHVLWITKYFGYTGTTQKFYVPYGVRRIQVRAVGAAGGTTATAHGGHGAIVDAMPWVRPGSKLYVDVGGAGTVTAAGWNGGGTGGGTGGAGGGGASDVHTFTNHMLAVAAGGGGAGNGGSCSVSGGAGGNAGKAGAPGVTCSASDVTAGNGGGGGAGTLLAGGAGGYAGAGGGTPGTAGGAGTSGHGGIGQAGSGSGTAFGDSGGGGGGYNGGGGGGSGGSGTSGAGPQTGAGGGGGGGSSLGRVVGLSYGKAYVRIRYAMPAPLAITTFHLPRAYVGHFYRTSLRARGGVPPYWWSMASGVLPRGLHLYHNGVISGTPRATGTRHFTVRVTDQTHRVAYRALGLTVAGHADLAVRLWHHGVFRYHHTGQYWMKVTNTGGAATTRAHPTRVVLALPGGLVARHWSGKYWHCVRKPHFMVCRRWVPIRAHHSAMIGLRVFVAAHPGTVVRSIARVTPRDATPADNMSVNLAVVRR